jgi:pimeloyl-ACP methyl ester carboxylesterase
MRPPCHVRARDRCAIALAIAFWFAPAGSGAAAERNVSLRTTDGLTLTATWFEPSHRPAPAVILVHMLGGSRRDWGGLGARLAADGIAALSLDLRGHGNSERVPTPSTTSEYEALLADIDAARRFLDSRPEVERARIGIAGASLGANLAALAGAADPLIRSLALLSPSLDYRGVRIEAAVRKYGGRPALLVASDDDAYAGRSVKELQEAGSGTREVLMLSLAGHGTHMLARDPGLARALVDWFRRTL